VRRNDIYAGFCSNSVTTSRLTLVRARIRELFDGLVEADASPPGTGRRLKEAQSQPEKWSQKPEVRRDQIAISLSEQKNTKGIKTCVSLGVCRMVSALKKPRNLAGSLAT